MNKTDDILNRLQQTPQPLLDAPDELTERIMSRLPERRRPRPQSQQVERRRWLYVAVGIAASVLLLIGVGVITLQRKDNPTELVADNVRKEPHPVESVPDDAVKEKHPVVSVPDDAEKENAPSVKVLDANLHYAAYMETKDTTDSLPPARMDEFIEKLAAYHHIEPEVLSDSTARSMAYVFPDNEKVRLFDRLLQVACSYSYDCPGYQMTISQQQLLFTLEDTRLSRRYLWLADRIGGGRIILYATHAPTGVAVSSEAYQEFRERTTHTNQTTEL